MLRRIGAFFIAVLLLFTAATTVMAEGEREELVPARDKDMELVNDWVSLFGCTLASGTQVTTDGTSDRVLMVSDLGRRTWDTPGINIYQFLKEDVQKNGSGRYQLSFDFYIVGNAENTYPIKTIIRSNVGFSIAKALGNQFLGSLGAVSNVEPLKWKHFVTSFCIFDSDITEEAAEWNFCFDGIPTDFTGLYLDDFSIVRISDSLNNTAILGTAVSDSTKYNSSAKPVASTPTPEPTNRNAFNALDAISTAAPEQFAQNLLPENVASMDASTVEGTGWSPFSSCPLVINSGGYEGNCIAMAGHTVTWASPSIDLSQFITEPGIYTFRFLIKANLMEDSSKMMLIIRGDAENSFIAKRGGNYYGDIGSGTLRDREWSPVVGTFEVTASDLATRSGAWTLCLSSVPLEISLLCIDNATLIKGTAAQLPEIGISADGQEIYLGDEEDVLYDESILKTVIIVAGITVAVTAVIIGIKARLNKAKKSKEDSREE